MAGYLFTMDYDITDQSLFDEFRQRIAGVVEGHGGKYLAREGASEALGEIEPQRVTVIEFANLKAAKAFLASADYSELREIRGKAAKSVVVATEGL